jgi:hypothetical protein
MPHLLLAWVQVHDGLTGWYDAKVIEERAGRQGREVRIHFHGWKDRMDIWLPEDSARILDEDAELPAEPEHNWGTDDGKLEDGQWEVERILGRSRKRGPNDEVMYRIQWKGIDPATKQNWAPSVVAASNIDPDLVDEYEHPPPEPPTPFTLQAPELVSAPIADTLVPEWLTQIARSAFKLLKNQREEFASRKLYNISPCPPWLFLAIQRGLARLADGLGPNEISGIEAVRGHRGGQFVADQFDITGSDLVERLLSPHNKTGHGALIMRENNTAVMLVPPLEFKFTTRRETDIDGRGWKTELVMTGHFMCLVDRGPERVPQWAFDDDRADYTPENKLAYKRAVARAMSVMGEGENAVVPAHLSEFLSLLV